MPSTDRRRSGRSVTWRAASDGIGHAVTRAAAFNTVCGRRAVLERLSWPVLQKCAACQAALRALAA